MQNGVTLENDPLLMQAFNEGDEEAFGKIFVHFRKNLIYFAKKLINNLEQSEDIVTDSFIKLYRKPASFKELRNVQAFLYKCTKNACIDWLRLKNAGIVVPMSTNDMTNDISESSSDEPFWATIQTELIIEIKALAENLPPACQKIFKMHYYEGRRVTDIAHELGISKPTVRNQLDRAIGKLRGHLALTSLVLLLIWSIFNYFIK